MYISEVKVVSSEEGKDLIGETNARLYLPQHSGCQRALDVLMVKRREYILLDFFR